MNIVDLKKKNDGSNEISAIWAETKLDSPISLEQTFIPSYSMKKLIQHD